jgi:hypothetical protein
MQTPGLTIRNGQMLFFPPGSKVGAIAGGATMAATTDPDDPGIKKIRTDGQQENYLVLSDEERAKGFVRPVRQKYTHLKCGTETRMGIAIAETYARDPSFYSGTFCVHCGEHFPLKDPDGSHNFIWPDGNPVGS